METLSVLTVEDGSIIAVSSSGERYRVPVDAALRARLMDPTPADAAKRLTPREIQAHVRAGMSPEQVAALAGAPVASIQRFVGPVLAELQYVIDSALQVRLPPESAGARPRTFGTVMAERLVQLDALGVRWSSAKEAAGWTVAVAFRADGVQHDARWRFDPKRLQLEPANVEASTLSQEGMPAALTPRLRALEPTAPVAVVSAAVAPLPPAAPRHEAEAAVDRSRFDSDAFRFPELGTAAETEAPAAPETPQPVPAAVRHAPETGPARPAPLRRVEEAQMPTADELDALARRRGIREPVVDTGALPVTRAMDIAPRAEPTAPRPVAPLKPAGSAPAATPPNGAQHRGEAFRRRGWTTEADATGAAPTVEPASPTPTRPRRGRTSMPSWDEIVFGRDD